MPLPTDMLEGYSRFRTDRLAGERQRYERLAERGQKPGIMVIGCCDSRAAPETIFDAGPGELFVVRNVANLVPHYTPDGEHHGTSAALEFAVMALRVAHIVVLGHGSCGGIAAALETEHEPMSPGDFIGKWISMIAPLADRVDKSLPPDSRQLALEEASVIHSLANLRSFPCVNILESRGKLKLHGAHFAIASGELRALDEATGKFSPV